MARDEEARLADELFTPPLVRPPDKPLSPLAAIAALRRNIVEAWDAELFDIPFRKGRWFGQTFVNACDPALMQAVFLDQVDRFEKSPAQQRVLRPIVGDGLLTVEGEAWRTQRRAAAPAFRHAALMGLLPTMAEVAEASAARMGGTPDGEAVDVAPLMTRAASDVIVQAVLAGDAGFDAAAAGAMASEYMNAVGKPDLLDLFGVPDWIPRPWRARYLRITARMRMMAAAALEARRARGQLDGGDLLGGLIAATDPETGRGLTDQELVDNILTFIGAGYETTAVTLTWALYLIASAPDVQARLYEEAAQVLGDRPITGEDVARLTFHDQVIRETMRLYPPVAALQRRAIADADLGPVQVRSGDEVVCLLYVLHRSRRLWDRPEAFDPDRFSPERSQDRHRFAFMPFGGGPRICIGAQFATIELIAFLSTFVRRFTFEPAPGLAPLPRLRFTLRPDRPMLLIVRSRLAAPAALDVHHAA
jgi:cytochrome P450